MVQKKRRKKSCVQINAFSKFSNVPYYSWWTIDWTL